MASCLFLQTKPDVIVNMLKVFPLHFCKMSISSIFKIVVFSIRQSYYHRSNLRNVIDNTTASFVSLNAPYSSVCLINDINLKIAHSLTVRLITWCARWCKNNIFSYYAKIRVILFYKTKCKMSLNRVTPFYEQFGLFFYEKNITNMSIVLYSKMMS